MKMWTLSATSILAGLTMLMGCGAVGAPIAPENVGVNLTIERQKQKELREEKQREATAEVETIEPQPDSIFQGQDVNPPPLQPVGTR